ncbi:MAG: trehalase family glycosidase [Gemmatimonadaceae bacterium]
MSHSLVLRYTAAAFLALGGFLAGCASGASQRASSTAATTTAEPRYDPSRDLGSLFHDVQMAGLFPDSKTFVDSRTRGAPAEVAAAYQRASRQPGFSLKDFVNEHFVLPAATTDVGADTASSVESHVRLLWSALTRPADRADSTSSLVPLPNPYVVPGGRFREVYYWDSYFTMLGLVESGRVDLVERMLDNFAYLIQTVGHIPNGNRTYYLSRSQPPYFGAMVGLFAQATDTTRALKYLPALEREYAFWMAGADKLTIVEATRRVVRLGDGSVLNRYWDDRPEPRRSRIARTSR